MEETSELLKLRQEKLEAWRKLGVDPFGSAYPNALTTKDALDSFEENKTVRIAGRLVSIRTMGKSVFAHIQDQFGKLQIYAQKQTLGDDIFAYWKLLDMGDFIGGEGTWFLTKTGEKTVKLTSLRLLSKSLRPIPSQWYGLADPEARYRQRYVDMIVNDDARKVLLQRSQVVREVRNFFESRGFNEVETPMMQAIASGAAAQPFTTHHKALNINLFLRIAPELYLKRLLVGGMGKIFEVNRNFRNEGIDRKHNPEFTMLEAYWAFADFELMADLVEELITTVAQNVTGSLIVGGEANKIDLTRPWKRARYNDLVTGAAGTDWFTLTPEGRRQRATELGVEIGEDLADFEVTNQVYEKLIEAKQRNPLFVTHLPKELVPLAKQNTEDSSIVDVFELVIGGQEISPGYSELNNPIVQRARLLEQSGGEKMNLDEDFLTALEYGMPPAGGIGIGIDRLVMIITGAESIRDVLLFPLMKPTAKS
jgi:lysyl-tRNA synthetase, class II